MALAPILTEPRRASYDVVIIGGAIMGSAAAWFLASNPGFEGRILVVERDPSYEFASTSHTNSCVRQQFSNPLNIRVSRFGVEYLKRFREELGGDPEVPEIAFQPFGYLYLAQSEASARLLAESAGLQAREGAATAYLSREELRAEFPFMAVDDLSAGSLGLRDEGYFDGATMFQWWRRKARERGVEYVTAEVAGIERDGGRVSAVRLASGARVAAGAVVNAAGPRAAVVARMAGVEVPVEPRRRYTFVFSSESPLPGPLPLTIDPSGIHVRPEGANFMAGCGPLGPDVAVDPGDFAEEPEIWEEKVWPALAARIPAFERIRLMNSWVGHYAFNTFDRNAIIGPVPDCPNFFLMNGFSGHGLQQAAAMGRGVSEVLVHGRFRTLDLSELGFERVIAGEPFPERNVI